MKMIACWALLLVAVGAVAKADPMASWTPPPSRFTEYEWKTNSPTWSLTTVERKGTVVWFYKEMSQPEALPVLLRALDYGETWLQRKAAEQLTNLTIPMPPGFADKVDAFYKSVDLGAIPRDVKLHTDIDRDRLSLKLALAP